MVREPDKVALGERLFNDPGLSGDKQMACADCHILEQGGDDNRPIAFAPEGEPQLFNTPTVFNAALNPTLNWRGDELSLESQADTDLSKRHHSGQPWPGLLATLRRDSGYRSQFDATYNSGITQENVVDALATFERTLITPAPFDRWLRGDRDAITAEAHEGYQLFKGLGCIACHQGINLGGNLYQRIGIFADFFADSDRVSDQHLGRYSLTGRERDRHVFRVPGLRNVAVTAPYFHDGRTAELATAVRQVARYQLGRELTDPDVRRLLAFLHSLTGEYRGRSLSNHD